MVVVKKECCDEIRSESKIDCFSFFIRVMRIGNLMPTTGTFTTTGSSVHYNIKYFFRKKDNITNAIEKKSYDI